MSPEAASIALALLSASPRPTLTTILLTRGTWFGLAYSKCLRIAGTTSLEYLMRRPRGLLSASGASASLIASRRRDGFAGGSGAGSAAGWVAGSEGAVAASASGASAWGASASVLSAAGASSAIAVGSAV